MTDKLTAYLIAGARLTGCKVSRNLWGGYTVSVGTVDYMTTKDDARDNPVIRNEWSSERLGPKRTRPEIECMTLDDVLRRNQPDLSSSASVQHYIDTGCYLPVTRDGAPT